LAVDFFLMLSGFVIALSYERRLQAGLSVVGFFTRRAKRLYPLAILGAVVGVAGLWANQSVRVGGAVPTQSLLTASMLNLLILPYFSKQYFDGNLFPANIPLWSLFAEIVVNVMWALGVVAGIRKNWKYAAIALSASGFCGLAILAHTANLGWGEQNYIGGGFRVLFCFLLGTLCFDFRHAIVRNIKFLNVMTLGTAMALALMLPMFGVGWDLLTVFLILPVLLMGGISTGTATRAPFLEFLGDISYPLYAIHFPILQVVLRLREKLFPLVPPWVGGIGALATSLVAAVALQYCYDVPIRRFLGRRRTLKVAPT
jgi:peptidoglycan/LPS O-acetylase OafA/YrhL